MTIFSAQSQVQYELYRALLIADYAEQNVLSGRWLQDAALQLAVAQFGILLPQGLDTPDHYMWNIHAYEDQPIIGNIWINICNRDGVDTVFIYDLRIQVDYRQKGHATDAVHAVEIFACSHGINRIALQVHGINHVAQAFYKALNFDVTNINLQKTI
jgi:RimJ/RimL family protein N-acetyltransferase